MKSRCGWHLCRSPSCCKSTYEKPCFHQVWLSFVTCKDSRPQTELLNVSRVSAWAIKLTPFTFSENGKQHPDFSWSERFWAKQHDAPVEMACVHNEPSCVLMEDTQRLCFSQYFQLLKTANKTWHSVHERSVQLHRTIGKEWWCVSVWLDTLTVHKLSLGSTHFQSLSHSHLWPCLICSTTHITASYATLAAKRTSLKVISS